MPQIDDDLVNGNFNSGGSGSAASAFKTFQELGVNTYLLDTNNDYVYSSEKMAKEDLIKLPLTMEISTPKDEKALCIFLENIDEVFTKESLENIKRKLLNDTKSFIRGTNSNPTKSNSRQVPNGPNSIEKHEEVDEEETEEEEELEMEGDKRTDSRIDEDISDVSRPNNIDIFEDQVPSTSSRFSNKSSNDVQFQYEEGKSELYIQEKLKNLVQNTSQKVKNKSRVALHTNTNIDRNTEKVKLHYKSTTKTKDKSNYTNNKDDIKINEENARCKQKSITNATNSRKDVNKKKVSKKKKKAFKKKRISKETATLITIGKSLGQYLNSISTHLKQLTQEVRIDRKIRLQQDMRKREKANLIRLTVREYLKLQTNSNSTTTTTTPSNSNSNGQEQVMASIKFINHSQQHHANNIDGNLGQLQKSQSQTSLMDENNKMGPNSIDTSSKSKDTSPSQSENSNSNNTDWLQQQQQQQKDLSSQVDQQNMGQNMGVSIENSPITKEIEVERNVTSAGPTATATIPISKDSTSETTTANLLQDSMSLCDPEISNNTINRVRGPSTPASPATISIPSPVGVQQQQHQQQQTNLSNSNKTYTSTVITNSNSNNIIHSSPNHISNPNLMNINHAVQSQFTSNSILHQPHNNNNNNNGNMTNSAQHHQSMPQMFNQQLHQQQQQHGLYPQHAKQINNIIQQQQNQHHIIPAFHQQNSFENDSVVDANILKDRLMSPPPIPSQQQQQQHKQISPNIHHQSHNQHQSTINQIVPPLTSPEIITIEHEDGRNKNKNNMNNNVIRLNATVPLIHPEQQQQYQQHKQRGHYPFTDQHHQQHRSSSNSNILVNENCIRSNNFIPVSMSTSTARMPPLSIDTTNHSETMIGGVRRNSYNTSSSTSTVNSQHNSALYPIANQLHQAYYQTSGSNQSSAALATGTRPHLRGFLDVRKSNSNSGYSQQQQQEIHHTGSNNTTMRSNPPFQPIHVLPHGNSAGGNYSNSTYNNANQQYLTQQQQSSCLYQQTTSSSQNIYRPPPQTNTVVDKNIMEFSSTTSQRPGKTNITMSNISTTDRNNLQQYPNSRIIHNNSSAIPSNIPFPYSQNNQNQRNHQQFSNYPIQQQQQQHHQHINPQQQQQQNSNLINRPSQFNGNFQDSQNRNVDILQQQQKEGRQHSLNTPVIEAPPKGMANEIDKYIQTEIQSAGGTSSNFLLDDNSGPNSANAHNNIGQQQHSDEMHNSCELFGQIQENIIKTPDHHLTNEDLTEDSNEDLIINKGSTNPAGNSSKEKLVENQSINQMEMGNNNLPSLAEMNPSQIFEEALGKSLEISKEPSHVEKTANTNTMTSQDQNKELTSILPELFSTALPVTTTNTNSNNLQVQQQSSNLMEEKKKSSKNNSVDNSDSETSSSFTFSEKETNDDQDIAQQNSIQVDSIDKVGLEKTLTLNNTTQVQQQQQQQSETNVNLPLEVPEIDIIDELDPFGSKDKSKDITDSENQKEVISEVEVENQNQTDSKNLSETLLKDSEKNSDTDSATMKLNDELNINQNQENQMKDSSLSLEKNNSGGIGESFDYGGESDISSPECEDDFAPLLPKKKIAEADVSNQTTDESPDSPDERVDDFEVSVLNLNASYSQPLVQSQYDDWGKKSSTVTSELNSEKMVKKSQIELIDMTGSINRNSFSSKYTQGYQHVSSNVNIFQPDEIEPDTNEFWKAQEDRIIAKEIENQQQLLLNKELEIESQKINELLLEKEKEMELENQRQQLILEKEIELEKERQQLIIEKEKEKEIEKEKEKELLLLKEQQEIENQKELLLNKEKDEQFEKVRALERTISTRKVKVSLLRLTQKEIDDCTFKNRSPPVLQPEQESFITENVNEPDLTLKRRSSTSTLAAVELEPPSKKKYAEKEKGKEKAKSYYMKKKEKLALLGQVQGVKKDKIVKNNKKEQLHGDKKSEENVIVEKPVVVAQQLFGINKSLDNYKIPKKSSSSNRSSDSGPPKLTPMEPINAAEVSRPKSPIKQVEMNKRKRISSGGDNLSGKKSHRQADTSTSSDSDDVVDLNAPEDDLLRNLSPEPEKAVQKKKDLQAKRRKSESEISNRKDKDKDPTYKPSSHYEKRKQPSGSTLTSSENDNLLPQLPKEIEKNDQPEPPPVLTLATPATATTIKPSSQQEKNDFQLNKKPKSSSLETQPTKWKRLHAITDSLTVRININSSPQIPEREQQPELEQSPVLQKSVDQIENLTKSQDPNVPAKVPTPPAESNLSNFTIPKLSSASSSTNSSNTTTTSVLSVERVEKEKSKDKDKNKGTTLMTVETDKDKAKDKLSKPIDFKNASSASELVKRRNSESRQSQSNSASASSTSIQNQKQSNSKMPIIIRNKNFERSSIIINKIQINNNMNPNQPKSVIVNKYNRNSTGSSTSTTSKEKEKEIEVRKRSFQIENKSKSNEGSNILKQNKPPVLPSPFVKRRNFSLEEDEYIEDDVIPPPTRPRPRLLPIAKPNEIDRPSSKLTQLINMQNNETSNSNSLSISRVSTTSTATTTLSSVLNSITQVQAEDLRAKSTSPIHLDIQIAPFKGTTPLESFPVLQQQAGNSSLMKKKSYNLELPLPMPMMVPLNLEMRNRPSFLTTNNPTITLISTGSNNLRMSSILPSTQKRPPIVNFLNDLNDIRRTPEAEINTSPSFVHNLSSSGSGREKERPRESVITNNTNTSSPNFIDWSPILNESSPIYDLTMTNKRKTLSPKDEAIILSTIAQIDKVLQKFATINQSTLVNSIVKESFKIFAGIKIKNDILQEKIREMICKCFEVLKKTHIKIDARIKVTIYTRILYMARVFKGNIDMESFNLKPYLEWTLLSENTLGDISNYIEKNSTQNQTLKLEDAIEIFSKVIFTKPKVPSTDYVKKLLSLIETIYTKFQIHSGIIIYMLDLLCETLEVAIKDSDLHLMRDVNKCLVPIKNPKTNMKEYHIEMCKMYVLVLYSMLAVDEPNKHMIVHLMKKVTKGCKPHIHLNKLIHRGLNLVFNCAKKNSEEAFGCSEVVQRALRNGYTISDGFIRAATVASFNRDVDGSSLCPEIFVHTNFFKLNRDQILNSSEFLLPSYLTKEEILTILNLRLIESANLNAPLLQKIRMSRKEYNFQGINDPEPIQNILILADIANDTEAALTRFMYTLMIGYTERQFVVVPYKRAMGEYLVELIWTEGPIRVRPISVEMQDAYTRDMIPDKWNYGWSPAEF